VPKLQLTKLDEQGTAQSQDIEEIFDKRKKELRFIHSYLTEKGNQGDVDEESGESSVKDQIN
jgi:hypothetical protein